MIEIEKEDLIDRFQYALFIVLENLLASGYGVFPPKADIHIIFNIVLMILGRFAECYIISEFQLFISSELYRFCLNVSYVSTDKG